MRERDGEKNPPMFAQGWRLSLKADMLRYHKIILTVGQGITQTQPTLTTIKICKVSILTEEL